MNGLSPGRPRSGDELQPVAGPSATAGGLNRFMTLLWVTASTDFRLSFQGTVLGYFWSLARPLMTFGILLAVFTQVFRLGDAVPNYPAMLLLNIMLFSLFGEATIKAVTAGISHEGVVRKTQFPRLVIPLAVVLTELMNFSLNLIAVFVFILAYGVQPVWTWLLLPVLLIPLLLITAAVAMLLSALYPRYRDVALIWGVTSTALFYATPILYPISSAPNEFRQVVQLNPLTPIFEQAEKWIINPDAAGAVGYTSGSEIYLILSVLGYISICVAGVVVFSRMAPKIAEEL